MQSTLFTTLTANEEANLSGGNKKKKDPKSTNSILANLAVATSTINQVGVGGDGGTAGDIKIGGGKGAVLLVGSPVSANANGGSVTNTATSNPVAVNAPG
ncbi:hypothetical protein [Nostoc sp.]